MSVENRFFIYTTRWELKKSALPCSCYILVGINRESIFISSSPYSLLKIKWNHSIQELSSGDQTRPYTRTAARRPSPRTTFITDGPEQLGPMGRLRRNYWTQSSLDASLSPSTTGRQLRASHDSERADFSLLVAASGGEQWGPSGPWPPCFGSFL